MWGHISLLSKTIVIEWMEGRGEGSATKVQSGKSEGEEGVRRGEEG
jgi:hypothetical protein